jgi:hypothetical protein
MVGATFTMRVWEVLRSGKTFGRRIMLGTGLPAYEFNYLLHGPGGEPEILRMVLHTTQVDRILSDARRMWWIVGGVLVLLWSVGIPWTECLPDTFVLRPNWSAGNGWP